MKSWKTTLAGAIMALGTFLENQTDPAWLPTVGKVMLGLGGVLLGMFARDNNVTSEQAGAVKKDVVAP